MTDASSPAALRCAVCDSAHLVWRVKRDHRAGGRTAERSLVWSCRECGSEQLRDPGHSPSHTLHEGIAGPAADLRGV